MNKTRPSNATIEASGLVKRYGEDVLAVAGVDLSIQANGIYALLGPNGAGKRTMISMLTASACYLYTSHSRDRSSEPLQGLAW